MFIPGSTYCGFKIHDCHFKTPPNKVSCQYVYLLLLIFFLGPSPKHLGPQTLFFTISIRSCSDRFFSSWHHQKHGVSQEDKKALNQQRTSDFSIRWFHRNFTILNDSTPILPPPPRVVVFGRGARALPPQLWMYTMQGNTKKLVEGRTLDIQWYNDIHIYPSAHVLTSSWLDGIHWIWEVPKNQQDSSTGTSQNPRKTDFPFGFWCQKHRPCPLPVESRLLVASSLFLVLPFSSQLVLQSWGGDFWNQNFCTWTLPPPPLVSFSPPAFVSILAPPPGKCCNAPKLKGFPLPPNLNIPWCYQFLVHLEHPWRVLSSLSPSPLCWQAPSLRRSLKKQNYSNVWCFPSKRQVPSHFKSPTLHQLSSCRSFSKRSCSSLWSRSSS